MIQFNKPFVTGDEKKYLAEVFESQEFSGNGPFTQKCQNFLSDFLQGPEVLLTHSCTAALEMMALLLDFKEGDELIVPSYTYPTSASAFLRAGAKIIFCEIEPQTMCISVEDALSKVTKNTKGILAVHYGGIAADVPGLKSEVQGSRVSILEDAAQALGSQLNGQPLGTMGRLSGLSFHETKNIHCGLGGALIINEGDLDRAYKVWERGTNRREKLMNQVARYSWCEVGSSFYPTEFQAAFLWGQLQAINENSEKRKSIYEIYAHRLKKLADDGRIALPKISASNKINYHSFFIFADSDQQQDDLRNHLLKNDIQAYIGYVPLHLSPMGKKLGYKREDLPVTASFSDRLLRLPFHCFLSNEDVHFVCDKIEEFYSAI